MHNVANIQRVDPLVLIEVPKDVLHISVTHLEGHATAQALSSLRLACFSDVGGSVDRCGLCIRV